MKVYKDFPRKGVDFLDINSELNDPIKLDKLRTEVIASVLSEDYLYGSVDKVVAIESRGFIFGTDIAMSLGAGLVLARKPGKLPGEVICQHYETEYSVDTIELQVSSINPGDRVLIHDDVLATGGTAKAVASLVESLGGVVLAYSFICEIIPLEGRKRLQGSAIISVLQIG